MHNVLLFYTYHMHICRFSFVLSNTNLLLYIIFVYQTKFNCNIKIKTKKNLPPRSHLLCIPYDAYSRLAGSFPPIRIYLNNHSFSSNSMSALVFLPMFSFPHTRRSHFSLFIPKLIRIHWIAPSIVVRTCAFSKLYISEWGMEWRRMEVGIVETKYFSYFRLVLYLPIILSPTPHHHFCRLRPLVLWF